MPTDAIQCKPLEVAVADRGIERAIKQLKRKMATEGIMKELKNVSVDEKEINHIVAIIDSMTPKERANHMLINGSRRRRISHQGLPRLRHTHRRRNLARQRRHQRCQRPAGL